MWSGSWIVPVSHHVTIYSLAQAKTFNLIIFSISIYSLSISCYCWLCLLDLLPAGTEACLCDVTASSCNLFCVLEACTFACAWPKTFALRVSYPFGSAPGALYRRLCGARKGNRTRWLDFYIVILFLDSLENV